MVYNRETAAVITIVANSTYNAQFARITCFIEKQDKATIQQWAMNESRERNWLATSWEQALVIDTALGNAVANVTHA